MSRTRDPSVDLVSIVIPAYNPGAWLMEAITSARAQTHPAIEIVLVNDGSDRPESLKYLAQAAHCVDVYLEQPNRGPASARNTGIRTATADLIVPLDADDVLEPEYVAHCISALTTHPDAAFAYSSYRIFGSVNRSVPLQQYNLYHLLEHNTLPYAALLRKQLWEEIGGYDESLRLGYEDWEFWLHAGVRGGFGVHIPKILFAYRKHGPSFSDVAGGRHAELFAYVKSKHPGLYEYEARSRIKTRWAPAVSILGRTPPTGGILDAVMGPADAPAVLVAGDSLDPESPELAALAVWCGAPYAPLPDGSIALSRAAADRRKDLPIPKNRPPSSLAPTASSPSLKSTWYTHLQNAELLSWNAWLRHPIRSVLRLVPLRVKERVNVAAGRTVFDLSYYLRFQPSTLLPANNTPVRLDYFPPPAHGRRRVALLTPHLGPGGAERVLLDIASALPGDRYELLVIATHSTDRTWVARWHDQVEHVFDLAAAIPVEHAPSAAATIVTNWRCDAVLLQNTLPGYLALPQIKQWRPETRLIDITHALDDLWDQARATSPVAEYLDLRLAVSPSVEQRLAGIGTPPAKILSAPNGVDVERFRPSPRATEGTAHRILFAGRLDLVKRPLLLVDIAARLFSLRKTGDFVFVIAGEGPEGGRLRKRISREHLDHLFDLKGHVDDPAPLIHSSDLCVLPSRAEGVPMIVLECLACARPVVASDVGAVRDLLQADAGILIERRDDEVEQFATAIHRLLDSPSLRERLGTAGRGRVEARYDLREARRRYLRVFDGLLF